MPKIVFLLLFSCLVGCGPGPQAEKLAAHSWVLQGMDGHAAQGLSLSFDAQNGKFGGSAPCNGFSGYFRISGSSLYFKDLTSSTMACSHLQEETALMNYLKNTESYVLEGEHSLRLNCAQGSLQFEAER